jgi:hypothetical protein
MKRDAAVAVTVRQAMACRTVGVVEVTPGD